MHFRRRCGQTGDQVPSQANAASPPPYETHEKTPNLDHNIRLPEWPDLDQTPLYNIEFSFMPKAKGLSLTPNVTARHKWEAQLRVCAKDVSRLMRQGFHWDASNVHWERGYFAHTNRKAKDGPFNRVDLGKNGWPIVRCFFLSDKAKDPEWTARLCVGAHEVPVLSGFRLGDLSVELIPKTIAWNEDGRLIYYFEADKPTANINVYYNNRPLEGWWPWPRNSR